jgi:hypothetical protein
VSIRPPDKGSNFFAFVAIARGMAEEEVTAIGGDPNLAERFFREVSGRVDIKFGRWQYLTVHRCDFSLYGLINC